MNFCLVLVLVVGSGSQVSLMCSFLGVFFELFFSVFFVFFVFCVSWGTLNRRCFLFFSVSFSCRQAGFLDREQQPGRGGCVQHASQGKGKPAIVHVRLKQYVQGTYQEHEQ